MILLNSSFVLRSLPDERRERYSEIAARSFSDVPCDGEGDIFEISVWIGWGRLGWDDRAIDCEWCRRCMDGYESSLSLAAARDARDRKEKNKCMIIVIISCRDSPILTILRSIVLTRGGLASFSVQETMYEDSEDDQSGWQLTESDPGVFTQVLSTYYSHSFTDSYSELLKTLKVPLIVDDLYTLERDTLASLQPIRALIFLFKWVAGGDERGGADGVFDDDFAGFFAHQVSKRLSFLL